MAVPGRVVVTGATGIAAATARQLAASGRRVFVISATDGNAQALAADLGEAAAGACTADLRVEAEAEQAFAAADTALGGMDGLVAVAGGSGRRAGDGPLHEIPLAGWDATLALNLTTAFLATREALRHFLAGRAPGSIVLTTSVLGWSPSPRYFATHAYAATKAALCGMTRTLAAAYAPDGIRVNAVAPGLVRTPMARRAAEDAEILAFAARKQPITGDLLAAEDVAAACCFALDAAQLTGQVIALDGGWTVSEGQELSPHEIPNQSGEH
ncbi:MAG: SDR family oxidoreductase [Propionicimonas sp.]|nr:SDR family oxidoreductase [Propionicimonas sp.]